MSKQLADLIPIVMNCGGPGSGVPGPCPMSGGDSKMAEMKAKIAAAKARWDAQETPATKAADKARTDKVVAVGAKVEQAIQKHAGKTLFALYGDRARAAMKRLLKWRKHGEGDIDKIEKDAIYLASLS